MSTYHADITAEIVAEHGLSADEYIKAVEIMGRAPNLLELGIFSVMWSEHCSYKSSKKWLKTLPTTGPQVIHGPGENAGVIDIGDNQACIFKIESHNHPSYIEPYQGAATGVGGILRDVFTMGARPIANLNALRFGDPKHPKTKHLVKGVVAGIGGYGNCVGVPTVGGETNFHPAYNGNCLVNAMTVGLADQDKIFLSVASDVGVPVVYVGSKTGRDGIHGATMASAEFDEDSADKRPTVQVGDPFTEKLLIEACLELMATDAILAIQDMGAAGLTSSSFEMASKGGTGVVLNLDQVPMREEGMTPYELMLSESQERMLMTLKPGREGEAKAIMDKWGLDFAVVGEVTSSGRMVLNWHGETVAELPIDPLALASPEYDRPHEPSPVPEMLPVPESKDVLKDLEILMGSADLCSRRWIWEQYDSQVMNDTLQIPGGDAAVVRVHGTNKSLAMSVDCSPRYCFANPEAGGAIAVAESYRNVTAVGATPLAVTNNLNFGNPEKPRIMGQIVGGVTGMGKACEALGTPVVSGNVSLYNETDGNAILPTPVVGMVGLMADSSKMASVALKRDGDTMLVIGKTHGHLAQSLYARECYGVEAGPAPVVDLEAERKNGDFVRSLIEEGLVDTCHDVSDGGLLVALTEMALAGGIGFEIVAAEDNSGFWFGEDQARYVVAVPDAAAVQARAVDAGVDITIVGKAGGQSLGWMDGPNKPLSEVQTVHGQALEIALA